jgi:glycopeptide antibiotics resistance protein
MKILTWLYHSTLVRAVILVIWLAFVMYLTTQPGSNRVIRSVRGVLPPNEWRDVIGHVGLMFILTGFFYLALAARLRWHWALLGAVIVALAIGTGTEYSQSVVRGRTFALSDLLSNWLGVLAMGFALSFVVSIRSNLRRQPQTI